MKELEKINEVVKNMQTGVNGDSLLSLKTALTDLLLSIQIKALLEDVAKSVGLNQAVPDNKEKADTSRTEAIERLEKIATNKKEQNGKRVFLLHRATANFEYAESAENREYETTEKTEWVPAYMASEEDKDGANPVVSCWIPEDSISHIPNPHPNTGNWGELGENPFAKEYKVIVNPGKYEIHQEYKGA